MLLLPNQIVQATEAPPLECSSESIVGIVVLILFCRRFAVAGHGSSSSHRSQKCNQSCRVEPFYATSSGVGVLTVRTVLTVSDLPFVSSVILSHHFRMYFHVTVSQTHSQSNSLGPNLSRLLGPVRTGCECSGNFVADPRRNLNHQRVRTTRTFFRAAMPRPRPRPAIQQMTLAV
jgi:hypothetical protein